MILSHAQAPLNPASVPPPDTPRVASVLLIKTPLLTRAPENVPTQLPETVRPGIIPAAVVSGRSGARDLTDR